MPSGFLLFDVLDQLIERPDERFRVSQVALGHLEFRDQHTVFFIGVPVASSITCLARANARLQDLPYFFFSHTSTTASTRPSCGLIMRSIPLCSGSLLKNVA